MKNRLTILALICCGALGSASAASLEEEFKTPPDSARPGVYWYFMDGNLDRKEMTADLESMKDVGLGNAIFLEVNVGVPRGPVDFMSEEWQELFAHAVHEAERLGIDITMGSGPGWAGSGGPWVKPEQAMQHLVFSTVKTNGPAPFDAVLPVPEQRPTIWGKRRSDFHEDVAVYAFPSCEPVIENVNKKALYERFPYSSMPGVKPYIPASAEYDEPAPGQIIPFDKLIDITEHLDAAGRLRWDVPPGNWTILRMTRRATCAESRPAPTPGLGLECDKFDAAALDAHLANYYDKLLEKTGPRKGAHGWTAVHIDSWEMGAQNWTENFLAEFEKRRGYDAKPWLPAFSGRAVGGLERSERFLWDVRLTGQELVLENHAGRLKEVGRKHGFELSIEPYDMNPVGDIDLGAVADVPMCEFWSDGLGFDSSFSCIEAASIAHTMGRPVVGAEAFTAVNTEKWQQYPWSMKAQGDWAFCIGVNRFVYHTFAHKPLGEEFRPGMTMGHYGVHWDRGQTWWPMVKRYHEYVSRCSHLMRQGVTVSDILYLTPEGAPHVFRAPASALDGTGLRADKKGYGFDGCSPKILMDRAVVENGRIVFPGATSYRMMVLPLVQTMTPELLAKVESLVKDGATVVGIPPVKSPSLMNYPQCDRTVSELAEKIWGGPDVPGEITKRRYGQGTVYYGGSISEKHPVVEKAILPESSWIWHEEGNSPPPGTRYFRRTITVDANKTLVSARSAATADNSFALWINGQKADQGANFSRISKKDITGLLHPGENILAIAAVNNGPTANYAGLIAAFELTYKDGSKELFHTDGSWQTAQEEISGWQTDPGVSKHWKNAAVLGYATMKPWNLAITDTETPAELYPKYDDSAALLKQLGVSEDFTATGPIRYGHRRTGKKEIYFVSNKTADPVDADCTFRSPAALRSCGTPSPASSASFRNIKPKTASPPSRWNSPRTKVTSSSFLPKSRQRFPRTTSAASFRSKN